MKKVICILIIINIIINIGLIIKPVKTYKNNLVIKTDNINHSTMNILDEYKDKETYIYINDKKIKTITDKSSLKNYKPGTYYVNYKAEVNDYLTIDNLQKVEVVDDVKPIIYADDEIILINSDYNEKKVSAVDNVDGDISSKVTIKGTVNTKKLGEYKITYTVKDSSENITSKVKKVKVVDTLEEDEEDDDEDKYWYLEYDNTITNMKYIDGQIYIEFYLKKNIDELSCIVNLTEYDVKKISDNFYSTLINIDDFKNGTYGITLFNEKSFNLKSELEEKYRLVRTRINDKLVTFIYKEDKVAIQIEDFKYEYDVLIDPGHGGSDIGSSNNDITEAEVNLIQSKYEKKRYEEHGLKVLLIREDDTYGLTYGSDDLPNITKRSLAVGYYGVTSKIVYSNHQNSNKNKSLSGWEILVPCILTYEDLLTEHKIARDLNEIYNIKDDRLRMYSKDYDTEIMYDKFNGEVYKIKDYYAVNREPLYLFNVISPIYENTYLSNEDDFNWFVTEKNYKKISEIKIKHYVESLNIEYKEVEDE